MQGASPAWPRLWRKQVSLDGVGKGPRVMYLLKVWLTAIPTSILTKNYPPLCCMTCRFLSTVLEPISFSISGIISTSKYKILINLFLDFTFIYKVFHVKLNYFKSLQYLLLLNKVNSCKFFFSKIDKKMLFNCLIRFFSLLQIRIFKCKYILKWIINN